MDTEALVVDAFQQLGLSARPVANADGHGADLILEADGARVTIEVKRRSLVTGDVARRLVAQAPRGGSVLLVVGDRVTEEARKLLTILGNGYYDLRGRLALHSGRVVVNADVEPVTERTGRVDALGGKAGLEVATALLMEPNGAAVRKLARDLSRSSSTVSEILAVLRQDDLLGPGNAVTDSRLFWQVADRWAAPRTYLSRLPSLERHDAATAPLRLGLDDVEHETGWALTGSIAAAAQGAPVAVRSGQSPDIYVPDRAILRRALTLLGAAASEAVARCSIRVAPVPVVCSRRIPLESGLVTWPLAHPLFVALDLAQDPGRGREILDAWTPGSPSARVW